MRTEIKWANKAVHNLKVTRKYIAEDSTYYASRFIRSLILETEKHLSQHPLSGRTVPELQDTPLSFLKEVIYKGYRIIYNPTSSPEYVTVITVISGRMDLLKDLSGNWVIE